MPTNAIIIAAIVIVFLLLFFTIIPVGLWISAVASGDTSCKACTYRGTHDKGYKSGT